MAIVSCKEPVAPTILTEELPEDLLVVVFDLNYQPSTGAPESREVTEGTLVSRPANPFRRGYSFGGWYRESGLETAWDFTSDTVTVDLVLYAKWHIVTSLPGQIFSLEFGHTSGAPDYCTPVGLPDDFGNGVLFSVWTKIPNELVAPSSFIKLRGNMEVFYLHDDNWHLICLDGNIDGYPDGYALYNANFMLAADGEGNRGDYCTYMTYLKDKLPLSTFNDWVWVAWQVVINADKTMTMRQWLKFGLSGTVFPAGNYYLPGGFWTPLDPEGEEIASISGWNPSFPKFFQIGTDNSSSGVNTGSNSYLCLARLEARSTPPTLPELEAIASRNAADPSAWGDWELNWENGAPNLTDRSGHGHDLTIQPGGQLWQGVLSPSF